MTMDIKHFAGERRKTGEKWGVASRAAACECCGVSVRRGERVRVLRYRHGVTGAPIKSEYRCMECHCVLSGESSPRR